MVLNQLKLLTKVLRQFTNQVVFLIKWDYDRSKPFEAKVPFYNFYRDTLSVGKPKAYIIPQGWWKVIDRQQVNNVQMRRLTRDTTIEVQWYRIENFQTFPRPYEGHHLNIQVKFPSIQSQLLLEKATGIFPLNQTANRFLIETLEPRWRQLFCLELFRSYTRTKRRLFRLCFWRYCCRVLKKQSWCKAKLDQKRVSDSVFAKNGRAQLGFVFHNSPYFEPVYLQYPIYRVMK